MSDIKRRIASFEAYDYTGIARHLERMAREGWMLEAAGKFLWTYRRIEPRELSFFVAFLPKSSTYDPEPTEEEWEFREFCRRTGWRLAGSQGQMKIFYNEDPGATPIETDPGIEAETIHDAAKRSFLPSWSVLLVLALMNIAMQIYQVVLNPVNVFLQSTHLLSMSIWLLILILCSGELLSYFLWLRRARRAARTGDRARSMGRTRLNICCLAALAVILAVWLVLDHMYSSQSGHGLPLIAYSIVYAVVLMAVVSGVSGLMKREKASRRANMAVTVAAVVLISVSMMALLIFAVVGEVRDSRVDISVGQLSDADSHQPPLELADIVDGDMGLGDSTRNFESSPLMSHLFYREHKVGGDWDFMTLEYDLYRFRAPLVGRICLDYLLKKYEDRPDREVYVPVDPSPWGVDRAWYLDTMNQYVLERDGDVAVLYIVVPDMETVTPERMGRIGGLLFG